MSKAVVGNAPARVVRTGLDGPVDVAVVIVNYNGMADTLRCLESLRPPEDDLCLRVVIDNGSVPDASAGIAAAHPWATVIRREENGGWAGGNNEGIRYALQRGARHVILLNNDTIVAPGFVGRLQEAARRGPDYGILGPVICFMDEPSVVMTDGCTFNDPGRPGFFHRHPVPLTGSGFPGITEVDIVNGCCMMVAAPVFERIGLIDERFFLVHEESDFCLRAQAAGFRCGVIGEALVWHKGSSSFRRTDNGLQRYFDVRNLFLLLRKHGMGGRGGRGRLASWREYLLYVYYRYAIAREQGEDRAADAVVRGLADALAGRFGPLADGRRRGSSALRGVLEFGRKARLRARTARG